MSFPPLRRAKLHSTNPLEYLNDELKRCADVGIFPNEAGVVQLIGAILVDQNDEWSVQQHLQPSLRQGLPI
jgi:transposase-like protein